MKNQKKLEKLHVLQGIHSLEVSILNPKNWSALFFLVVWIIAWLSTIMFLLKEFEKIRAKSFEQAFLIFWLFAWGVMGGVVLYAFFLQIFGKEQIIVARGVLKIEKTIYGIGKKKQFHIRSIKNLGLHLDPKKTTTKNKAKQSFIKKNGKLRFNYQNKKITFGNGISSSEALSILSLLKENKNFNPLNFKS